MTEQTEKPTHLKCITNGRVFIYTDALMTRSDMVACDSSGNTAVGIITDVSMSPTGQRVKTKYLGNLANGVLYPYTEYLAERPDMISIDTIEQWEAKQKTGEVPPVAADTVAPSLKRDEVKAPPAKKSEDVGAGNSNSTIPDISALGAREAKTVLSDWAMKNHKRKLDRRLPIDQVLAECKTLEELDSSKDATG